MISFTRLWAAQKAEWPNSIQLLPHDMLIWANSAHTIEVRLRRFMLIAVTTQHDRVLFYITDPKGGYIGARYGLEGGDYISGFSDIKQKIKDTKIVDVEEDSSFFRQVAFL
jgi:hypothetical protein